MRSLKFNICDFSVTSTISMNRDFSVIYTVSVTIEPRFIIFVYQFLLKTNIVSKGLQTFKKNKLIGCIQKNSFDKDQMLKDPS